MRSNGREAVVRRLALWVILVSIGLWGVALFLVPAFVWETLGGSEPVAGTYSRYSGAWFIGVAVAAWFALKDRTGEEPVLVVATIGGGLSFVVLLIDVLNDTSPVVNAWIIWLAIIDAAAIAVLGGLALREQTN